MYIQVIGRPDDFVCGRLHLDGGEVVIRVKHNRDGEEIAV